MLGRSRYSRTVSANVGEIERRVRSLEQRVRRVGGRASASAAKPPTMSARASRRR